MIRDYHEGHGRARTSTRLWAGEVTGLYNMVLMGYNTTLALSYQHAGQAAGILPEWRYQGDVSVELFRNTTLTFEYRHDRDFDERHRETFCEGINDFAACEAGTTADVCFGTSRNANQAALRLSVVF